MFPFAQGDAKLLPLEGRRPSDTNAARIPEEYLQLLLPAAAVYTWQQADAYILSQHVELKQFSLWVHDVASYSDQVICPFAPFPFFILQYQFESCFNIRMPHTGPFQLDEDACNLFYLETGISYLPLEAGTKAVTLLVNIMPEHMRQLAKSYPAIQQRLNKMKSNHQVLNKHPYEVNAISHLLISKIMTCRYLRQDAVLYLERCCADLFKIYCRQYAITDKSGFNQDISTYNTYLKLFEYLRTNLHLHHDINKLSWMFGIPSGQLAIGFLNTFALTIKECLHMLKMMQAFSMLMQHSHSFSDIATAVDMDTEKMIISVEKYYNFKVTLQRN
jgi:AraC-like DNA-binding protein